MQRLMKHSQGMTLIELMIVTVVLAILATIAVPSYQSYVRKATRSEAKEALMSAQLMLEEYRISCSQYGQRPSDCTAVDASTLVSSNTAHYTFTLTNAAAATYTLSASARGNQAQDSEGSISCATLSVDQNDNKTPAQCW
ncbi:type IV pilin protein [Ferrimonas gelatinilytica]|uniref:Type IV pilin protein n=1 Tax=Ferrimonas gelatinilytica TaxID=1255257 RepID=A0ABP9SBZ2_9GAMM